MFGGLTHISVSFKIKRSINLTFISNNAQEQIDNQTLPNSMYGKSICLPLFRVTLHRKHISEIKDTAGGQEIIVARNVTQLMKKTGLTWKQLQKKVHKRDINATGGRHRSITLGSAVKDSSDYWWYFLKRHYACLESLRVQHHRP